MARNDMHGLNNQKDVADEVETEKEKDTFSQRLFRIRDKLKLGPHYKMERFSVLLGAALVFLLLFTTLAFVNYRSDVANLESTQAVITPNFTFSLSSQQMYIDGVYGNKDKTDVMVLLRMNDANSMSTNAKKYHVFITGESGSLDYTPKTSLAFFGSTGYGILRFQSKTPLPKEIMSVTLRANSEISEQNGSGTSGIEDDTDTSFAQYDQGKFYVNPGADGVKTLKNFKTGEDDPTKLYMALVADAKDKEIKKTIKDQTKQLGQLLTRSDEYHNRLVSSGYIPPKSPWFIEGDYIDNAGVFRPAKDVLRAHTFDYYTKSIHDGYINQVMSDFSKYDAYMKKHSDDNGAAYEDDPTHSEDVAIVETIKREDGTTLDLNTVAADTSPTAQVAAKSAVDSLQNTWRTYITMKAKFQRDTMRSLLVLDADVLSQTDGFSENHSKKLVQFY